MGLRRLLTRQSAAADPLERLAEMGREQAVHHPHHPSRQKAPAKPPDPTAGVSVVPDVKKCESIAEPIGRVVSGKLKRESPRPPSYVWRSQRSDGNLAMRFGDTTF